MQEKKPHNPRIYIHFSICIFPLFYSGLNQSWSQHQAKDELSLWTFC